MIMELRSENFYEFATVGNFMNLPLWTCHCGQVVGRMGEVDFFFSFFPFSTSYSMHNFKMIMELRSENFCEFASVLPPFDLTEVIYMYIHTYVCTCIYMYTYIYLYIYTKICICIYIDIDIDTHIHMNA